MREVDPLFVWVAFVPLLLLLLSKTTLLRPEYSATTAPPAVEVEILTVIPVPPLTTAEAAHISNTRPVVGSLNLFNWLQLALVWEILEIVAALVSKPITATNEFLFPGGASRVTMTPVPVLAAALLWTLAMAN